MPRRYLPEIRRQVVELARAGTRVGQLAITFGMSEVAGAGRFSSDAKLARAAGVAPIPVSSGNTNRHRLDRGGNRQINATLHRVAVTRLRCEPPRVRRRP